MKSDNIESGLCRMKSCFGLFYLEASVNQTYMSFIPLTRLVYEMKNISSKAVERLEILKRITRYYAN